MQWDMRYYPDKYVTVCAGTSVDRGLVHFHMLYWEAFT